MPAESRFSKTAASDSATRSKAVKPRSVPKRVLRDGRLNSDVNEILEIVADAQRAVDRQLKSLSRTTKLSSRGIFILSLINAGLDRGSLLVEYFDSLHSTMTLELDRLVDAGLVKRMDDASDRRIVRLVLTKKGNKFREDVMDIVNAMFIPRISGISSEDLRFCVDTLKKIVYPPSVAEE